uniref:Uncharacterized protein n=1 Tax=Solanum tuberosum TaxID=4113 RepID=M1DPT3_SOLTU
MSLLLTNMIRCFRVKSKEERAKIGYLVRGWKIEDEVAEKKGQEAREYTTREHIRVAELIRVCRKEFHLTVECEMGARREEVSPVCNYRRGNRSALRTWTAEIGHVFYFRL